MIELGEFRLTTISGGRFRIDGGTMFGVVPRALWSRHTDVDESNTIAQNTNCLLVRTPARTVLIDTGYGSKLRPKQRQVLHAESGNPLLANLAEVQVQAAEIDMVILTHLHFDHAGGCAHHDEHGDSQLSFPNATYVVQKGEWELARRELPELRNAYPQENLDALADSEQLQLIDGEVEITAGIHALPTPGHTEFHQSILVESQGQSAVYLGDLCPTSAHLSSLWCMAYDTHMIETRRQKPRVLGQVADDHSLAIFDHDPRVAAARLQRDSRREFIAEELLETL